MFRKFVSSLAAIVLLAGCSGGGSSASPTSTGEKIVKNLNLTEKMDVMDESQINGLFFFEDGTVKSSSLYLANDQTADVVGVFEAENMDSVKQCVRTYLETTKLQNQNYNPEEVFKIDNAVIDDNGKTLILIVCDDLESAKKEAKTALGK